MKEKIYGVADRAWQIVVGCDPSMSCAPRCWARKTVARIVRCQATQSQDRAKFFQIALTPDGKKWSGQTFIDPKRLCDPLRWKKPGLVATGFHGDWGRLDAEDMIAVLRKVGAAQWLDFMLLSKQPASILTVLANRRWRNLGSGHCEWQSFWVPLVRPESLLPGEQYRETDKTFLPNATLGCSVMNQAEADKYRLPMCCLSALGWRTHVWYEPAIGPVDWRGWEFVERVIVGGETANAGYKARPFVDTWAYATLDWCREHGVKFWMKQMGQNPVNSTGQSRRQECAVGDRKGEDLRSLPELLRVREEVGGPRR